MSLNCKINKKSLLAESLYLIFSSWAYPWVSSCEFFFFFFIFNLRIVGLNGVNCDNPIRVWITNVILEGVNSTYQINSTNQINLRSQYLYTSSYLLVIDIALNVSLFKWHNSLFNNYLNVKYIFYWNVSKATSTTH